MAGGISRPSWRRPYRRPGHGTPEQEEALGGTREITHVGDGLEDGAGLEGTDPVEAELLLGGELPLHPGAETHPRVGGEVPHHGHPAVVRGPVLVELRGDLPNLNRGHVKSTSIPR